MIAPNSEAAASLTKTELAKRAEVRGGFSFPSPCVTRLVSSSLPSLCVICGSRTRPERPNFETHTTLCPKPGKENYCRPKIFMSKSGALNDPVPFDAVVQRWLLVTDRDHIAVGLSFESPSMRNNCKN